MATAGHIAARRDQAVKSLQESGAHIASLLNIQPPDLSIWFRDYDLLQAEQLQALAMFNLRVQAALEAQSKPEIVTVSAPAPTTRAKRGGSKS